MSKVVIATVEPYGSQSHLTESDVKYIESLSSNKRRAEIASWRDLLRRSFAISADILYFSSGAPYIADSEAYISVSHSSTYVVVMLSDSPCAIDIESISRNFERVSSRYVTDAERELLPNNRLLLPILWSTKEALFKLSPLDGLDFLNDIEVVEICDDCTIRGRVKGCDGDISMRYFIQSEHVIVYV